MVGASFDTVEEQKDFATSEGFGYPLISDPDRAIGRAYQAERNKGADYADYPRRITYLIDPDGMIAETYDMDGRDLNAHAAEVLAAIAERS